MGFPLRSIPDCCYEAVSLNVDRVKLTCVNQQPPKSAVSANASPRSTGLDIDQGERTRRGQDLSQQQQQREQIMPTGEVLFVTALIMAFGVFAIVLGWADRRTRHLDH
jgi:hypothetical protein